MVPYWKAFIEEHGLVGEEICFVEEVEDLKIEQGVAILSDEHARQEEEEAYPGIVVVKDGFRAVGGDVYGSGDPYFINERDGVGDPLYKIYHESVLDESYRREDAIKVVFRDYRELLKHRKA